MTAATASPAEAQRLIERGATLIDIRNPDEHAREHIPGARNIPLSDISNLPDDVSDGPLIFHCRSGMRTSANAAALLSAAGGARCYTLDGGLNAWKSAGMPTRIDPRQPLEIMRQVQLVAGGLVLTGIILGFAVAPAFFGLSAFVGAGLMMAGATGWCGMAKLLAILPWNRPARSI